MSQRNKAIMAGAGNSFDKLCTSLAAVVVAKSGNDLAGAESALFQARVSSEAGYLLSKPLVGQNRDESLHLQWIRQAQTSADKMLVALYHCMAQPNDAYLQSVIRRLQGMPELPELARGATIPTDLARAAEAHPQTCASSRRPHFEMALKRVEGKEVARYLIWKVWNRTDKQIGKTVGTDSEEEFLRLSQEWIDKARPGQTVFGAAVLKGDRFSDGETIRLLGLTK